MFQIASFEICSHSPSRMTEIGSSIDCKPPNILIYADSEIDNNNVRRVLQATLANYKYLVS